MFAFSKYLPTTAEKRGILDILIIRKQSLNYPQQKIPPTKHGNDNELRNT